MCIFCGLLPTNSALAVTYNEEAENRKSMAIESNSYENWPLGPAIGAQSAILIEANTGTILYEKNIYEKLYPASITKLLTTYIALQECELNEMVTFSQEAVDSINWREDANMGVNAGSSITMEETLYGILVGSANEAAYAVAEHISGSLDKFAVLMNKTAKELGCTSSNFVTPNGIHDENHYTTAYDMALIAQAFFSNDTLCKMAGTTWFEVPVTKTQPRKGIILSAKSELHSGKRYAYDALVGTKTGYTNFARQTLVSCASKNGLKLICVILKEESPAQFADTVELFEYGFHNFSAFHLSDVNTEYTIDNTFFTTDIDILGNSQPILSIDKESYLVLPNTINFETLTSTISYDTKADNEIASIHYFYKNYPLGKIAVKLQEQENTIFDFSTGTQTVHTDNSASNQNQRTIFINMRYFVIISAILVMVAYFSFGIHFTVKRKRNAKHRKNRLHHHLNIGRHWDISKYE